MSAELAQPLREALVGAAAITALLPAYKGSFTVFTRRPAPDDAEYPLIMVSPDIASNDQDGIADERPVIQRDVAAYGSNDTPEKYRAVESIARQIHTLFHRQRTAIVVPGWHVVDIVARWPMPAPTDDEKRVGRVVPLTIRLAKHN